MCGAPKEQVITQKTELQPGLLRHYYGGTLADPRGGFANGGPVGGITSINPPQAPMMGGGLANLLSDPMMAAALSSTVRSPEIRYGQLGANPMASQTIDQAIQGYAQGGYIQGPGTGTSDSIPAKIYQDGVPVQEAALSDGEFVMTKRAVDGAGGAARMYEMMRKFERVGMT